MRLADCLEEERKAKIMITLLSESHLLGFLSEETLDQLMTRGEEEIHGVRVSAVSVLCQEVVNIVQHKASCVASQGKSGVGHRTYEKKRTKVNVP
jgi:hypothetical protein